FPYELLWGERSLCSVANLTRKDAEDFMKIAPDVPVQTFVETFPLADANEALERFRTGQVRGSGVLRIYQLDDSCTSIPKSEIQDRQFKFKISDLGFEMQESSNSKFLTSRTLSRP